MAYYTDPNQTKFSLEEPLFEQTGQIPQDEILEPQKQKPLLKQKKFVISLIVGVTLLILLLLYLVNAYIESQKLVQDTGTPDATEEAVSGPKHPLLQRIESAQIELKDADPSEQDLVYPTMDYDIRLDRETR